MDLYEKKSGKKFTRQKFAAQKLDTGDKIIKVTTFFFY